jgi:choline-sulfatase
MLNRRSFLAGSGGCALAQGSRKPNFLFIIADDHAGYVLGADGNRRASTPNLDRLAAEGMRFARHHCNSPVCTPSRQSFFTGQMPSMAGVTVLKTPLADDKPTLARQLRGAGYHTAVFGKMHFNQKSRSGLHGFEQLMLETDLPKAWQQSVEPKPPAPGVRVKPEWKPFRDPVRIWLNAEKLPYRCYYDDMPGTFLARQAVKYLEEHKSDGPFGLWVSFQEPHSPFNFPIEYTNRYDPAEFPVPQVGPEDAWQVPLIFRDLTPQEKQGIIAAYYTSVAFLDRNIGVVLDALRRLGLDRDTLVVYIADHGYDLGQHGRFEKHCCYDPALRVPLLMRWPGHVHEGVVNDFTESIDVAPTILDLLGIDRLPLQHGQSLRAYVEGARPAAPREHIFSQYLENEEACIRTDRYKFILCSGKRKREDGYETDKPTPGRYIRLYQLQKDPGELTDIAKREPELVTRFEKLMLERFLRTHPEAERVPGGATTEEKIEWFLRPRDA